MIYVFHIEEHEKWDAIVRTFSNYDVYYLSGYVKAFQIHGDGEPLLFYYEGGNLRGINVVMKRDVAKDVHFAGKIPEGRYFDFATPYGYGGWLIEGEGDENLLFEEYERWCRKCGIISEFVRFHPVQGNHVRAKAAYEVIPLGETVIMDLSSPETIWEGFSGACRNRVRKASKSGVKIFNGRSPEVYEEFRQIYNETMDRDNAVNYYYFSPAFYDSVLDDLSEHAQVFFARHPDGITIAAAIMLTTNGCMNYHLGGSLREYSSAAPMNLLFYQAALWGSANGCKSLYLGGGVGSGDDSLLRFKKTFQKGELNRFYIGKKILCVDRYDELMELRRQTDPGIDETTFFPAYRGGGGRLSNIYILCADFDGDFLVKIAMESRKEAA